MGCLLIAILFIKSPGDNCVVFEDSKVGVQAALGAGIRVIGISTSHTEEELLDEGVFMVINDFTNLKLDEILNPEL